MSSHRSHDLMRQSLLCVLGLLLSSAPRVGSPNYLRAHVADWPTWIVPERPRRPHLFTPHTRWSVVRDYIAVRLPQDDAATLRGATNPHLPVVRGGICGTGLYESMVLERIAADALLFLAYPVHTLRALWLSDGAPRAGPGGILAER